jgi:hypothetical protein
VIFSPLFCKVSLIDEYMVRVGGTRWWCRLLDRTLLVVVAVSGGVFAVNFATKETPIVISNYHATQLHRQIACAVGMCVCA